MTNFLHLDQLISSNGGSLVIVPIPINNYLDYSKLEEYSDLFFKENKIPVFRTKSNKSMFWKFNNHLNIDGHAEVFNTIQKSLNTK